LFICQGIIFQAFDSALLSVYLGLIKTPDFWVLGHGSWDGVEHPAHKYIGV